MTCFASTLQGQPSYFMKSLMDIAQKGPPAKVWGATMTALVVMANMLALTLISWAAGKTVVSCTSAIVSCVCAIAAIIALSVSASRR